MELAGRKIVVTGASGGIGTATAIALGQAGASILLQGRSAEKLERTVDQIARLSGGKAETHAVPADFTTLGGCHEFLQRCWEWNATVDGWVHCAGADILTTDLRNAEFGARLETLWQVDVRATMLLLRECGDRMKEMGAASTPSIITIGWDQAATGMEGDAGLLFGTVKGAVSAMTRALARTLAPDVRVNCVAPGWIRTAWGDKASPEWDKRAKSESMMQRWGTAEDVARTVLFLLSGNSGFINGQIVEVNGGFAGSRNELTSINKGN